MNNPAPESAAGRAPLDSTAASDPADLSSLYHYPALGRLFDQPDSPQLAEMRAQLTRSNQALERVVRQGTTEEAARATRAARAYEETLGLLVALEKLQREQRRAG